ncbi:hypothetical protein MA16_Dca025261 [Dendrobium catenatum]|uniref:Uncharacterized protein n=1 Tax=Dendrobium catenatum TaxID=906689 RepID=A0A2I0W162_9ASPA|nr:hypothetical protein MA16_Dca025261 [Dendrobium catenatum]
MPSLPSGTGEGMPGGCRIFLKLLGWSNFTQISNNQQTLQGPFEDSFMGSIRSPKSPRRRFDPAESSTPLPPSIEEGLPDAGRLPKFSQKFWT